MSFARYAEYRDSSVEWLGTVPEHWEVLPLKRRFDVVGGSTPKSDDDRYWDGDVLWATPADLSGVTSLYIGETGRRITADGLASCGTNLVPAGSLILSTRAPIGSLAIASVPMCTNQGCKTLVPRVPVDVRYFAWLLEVNTAALNVRGKGTTFLELSADELASFAVPVPRLQEQVAIAAFLDRETAKIDALVGEQERLIELLKEKRQAVISHAVTKGLNPSAQLKDSGVTAGGIPAHWRTTTVKRFSTLQRGYDLTEAERTEGPYPVVTSGGSSGTHGTFMARAPGVVTGRYGSTGNLFYIEQDFWPHNTSLFVSDFHGNNERFVWYALQTIDFRAHAAKAAVPGVDRNDIHVIPVVVPPAEEQAAIVLYLDESCARIDALLDETARATGLLQERRTALISAAVTGQIDVRTAAERSAA